MLPLGFGLVLREWFALFVPPPVYDFRRLGKVMRTMMSIYRTCWPLTAQHRHSRSAKQCELSLTTQLSLGGRNIGCVVAELKGRARQGGCLSLVGIGSGMEAVRHAGS
jgi:hypothetical protein